MSGELENMAVPPEFLTAYRVSVEKRATRKRFMADFTKFPRVWRKRLEAAKHIATYRLALFLLHENWKRPGEPIVVSNMVLKDWGIERRSKYLALPELERLGLINAEYKGKASPRVKLLL